MKHPQAQLPGTKLLMSSFMSPLTRKILFFCTFLSGVSALIFQVLWVRLFGFFLGHTTLSASIVVAAFMAGISIGNIFGDRIQKLPANKLILYAWIEFLIGLSCVLVTGILYFLHTHTMLLSHPALSYFSIFLGITLCCIPMGVTFPVLVSVLVTEQTENEKTIGILYGINTAGAVIGILFSGFYFLPRLGMSACFLIGSLLNFISGILSLSQQNNSPFLKTTPETSSPIKLEIKPLLLSVIFALTGFASISSEIAWTRALSMVLGSSTYAFSIVVMTMLIGLTLGSLLFSKLNEYLFINWIGAFILTLMTCFTIIGYLPVFNHLPYLYVRAFPFAMRAIPFMHLTQFMIAAVIMFFPALLMGIAFPWALSLNKNKNSYGFLYAMNTIGGILGALITGLYFLPKFGVENSLLFNSGIYLLSALILFPKLEFRFLKKLIATVLAISAFIFAVLLRPHWDPVILTSGAFLYAPDYYKLSSYREFVEEISANRLLFYEDGLSSTVAVYDTPWGEQFLRVNGKTDASSGKDMITQLVLGHLPLLIHQGSPEKVLVIGFGSGVTSGVLSTYKELKKIVCVEIEPSIIKAASYFSEINRNVTQDPRFQVVFNDARRFLHISNEKFDAITSEPSNPWLAGVANLYTKEAFEEAKARLNDDGVFCQWFHSYSMGSNDFKMIVKTFCDVFPETLLFTTCDADFFLVGMKQKHSIDYQKLKSHFENNPAVYQDLLSNGMTHPYAFLGKTFLLDDEELRAYSANAQIHIDNKPTLEFSAPRFLHRGEHRQISDELYSFKTSIAPKALVNFSPTKEEDVMLQNIIGENLIRTEKIDKADDLFAKLTIHDPKDPRTWTNIGRIHNLRGEHLKAEESFRKAVTFSPKYSQAWFHLGMLYLTQGFTEKGLSALEKALTLNPGDPMGTLQVAQIYLKNNRRADAEKILKVALEKPAIDYQLYSRLSQLLNAITSPSKK